MRKGSNVIVNWPKVYPPVKGKVKSVDKEKETAKVFCMGSIVEFPLKRLEKI